MKRAICKLIGHLWNEGALEFGVNHCDRCGYSDDYGIKVAGEWTLRDAVEDRLWRMNRRIRFRWQRVKWFFTGGSDHPF